MIKRNTAFVMSLLTLVASGACGGTSSSVAPTPPQLLIVDQSYEPHSATEVAFSIIGGAAVQTFTVGVTGKLAAVDLIADSGIVGLIAPDLCAQGFTLDVQVTSTTIDGIPSSQVLAAGRVPSNMLPSRTLSVEPPLDFTHVALSPLVDVVAGNVLAISATLSGFRCGEIRGGGTFVTPSTYAGGEAFFQGPQWFAADYADYYFRTHVIPRQ